MDVDKKRLEEKRVLREMFLIFCEGRHGSKGELCEDCEEIYRYACERVDRCPNMESKTFCSACKRSCYKKSMRERVREVMKFSGPRMIFKRPGMALKHAFVTIRNVLKNG